MVTLFLCGMLGIFAMGAICGWAGAILGLERRDKKTRAAERELEMDAEIRAFFEEFGPGLA